MLTTMMTKLVTKTMTAGDLPVAQWAQSTNEQLRPAANQVDLMMSLMVLIVMMLS